MAVRAAETVALTWDDLQQIPDDGFRRELVNGQLLMTPGPAGRHQNVVNVLHLLLGGAATRDLKVFTAPYDWKLSESTVFEPDLLVFRRSDYDPDGPFTGTPLLVVEVLSPSTADTDRTLKRFEYEKAGAPAYWLVDPVEPGLTVLHLVDGTYQEVATVRGEEAYEADQPFPVTVVPARLVE